jgi:glycosyltransferase involved in cell wall biosynthesis
MTDLDLTIVVPVFNEAESLSRLHEEITAALLPTDLTFEVLYVDDGSTDDSPRVLRALSDSDPRVRTVRLRQNSGQTAAFGAGFRGARGRWIATLDADLQNDPADLPRMLAELEDCDIVCGIRTDRHDAWVRKISSRIANSVRNRLTHESVTDVGCSLRVFRSHLARDLPLFTGMHRFLPTLLRMQGGTLREIPVRHRPRVHGKSKYGIHNRLWVGLADLFAVRWMQKRWIDSRMASETTSDSGANPSDSTS